MDAPNLAMLDHVRALGERVAAEFQTMQSELSVTAISKGGVEVVTAADTRSEHLLTEALATAYPQHRIADV